MGERREGRGRETNSLASCGSASCQDKHNTATCLQCEWSVTTVLCLRCNLFQESLLHSLSLSYLPFLLFFHYFTSDVLMLAYKLHIQFSFLLSLFIISFSFYRIPLQYFAVLLSFSIQRVEECRMTVSSARQAHWKLLLPSLLLKSILIPC